MENKECLTQLSTGIDNEYYERVRQIYQDIWDAISPAVKRAIATMRDICKKIERVLLKDKEYRRLVAMEQRVRTKRLKKKYRVKKRQYVLKTYGKL